MTRLSNKVAIVTGGGQGIGRGIALAFAAEGATVIVAEINPVSGRAVESEIVSRGDRARFFECDVSRRESVDVGRSFPLITVA